MTSSLKQPLLGGGARSNNNNNDSQNKTIMLDSSSALNDASLSPRERRNLQNAIQLSGSIRNIVSSPDGKGVLLRQLSNDFVQSFQKAESMIENGVEGYISAVRRLLNSGHDAGVSVALKNFTYSATVLEDAGEKREIQTIGTELLLPFRKLASCFTKSNKTEKKVLSDITCYIPSGRLTLVLSPPGSGKTTFLKAISRQLLDGKASGHIEGTVAYNGRDVKTVKNLGAWASYVPQGDDHQALLTVKETLKFAWESTREAVFTSKLADPTVKQSEKDRLLALKMVELDISLAVLGLSNCENTIIGNDTTKGVSGGEKRRVTLGETLVTGSRICCADEISTGLDSSTTYDIVSYLQQSCRVLDFNIVVALLQPPPEVIELFDDVVVLSEGHLVYHGPVTSMLAYFEGLGFTCPERKDVGDFIVEVVTSTGAAVFKNPAKTNQPQTPLEFAKAWKESEMFKTELKEVNHAMINSGGSNASYNHDLTPRPSFIRQLALFSSLEMKLRLRQKAQLASKVFANVVMGAFFGSLFYQLGNDQWYLKAMLLFQIPSFVSSTSFPVTQIIAEQKKIYLKHIDARFYTSLVFTIGQFFVTLPFIIFDVAVFGNVVYWMCGLSAKPEVFLTFLALSVSFGIQSNSLNTMIPFITSTQESAVMLGILFLCTFMINCGLVATPNIIPTVLKPLFWFNPMTWVYRALAINEYHSGGAYDDFPCSFEIQGVKITVQEKCGDYFLESRQTATEDKYVPDAIFVMWGMTVLALLVTVYAVKHVRFEVARSRKEEDRKKQMDDLENQKFIYSQLGDASRKPKGQLQRQQSILVAQKTLCIRNLTYTIKINGEDIDFLKSVSFWAVPGRMTALMGSSGAGKSTLMDVIVGRKTVGRMKGDVLVNGISKTQLEFQKYAGYVEQQGVHAPASTVRESLEFSAALRLNTTYSKQEIDQFLEEVMELLELKDIENSLCLSLSMEQNKRLTLGVELVASPSIVFADEPTSGLDARAAAIVMRVLKNVAKAGRVVVCTIHQPSQAVFNFFDDLLLLKKGGEVVYFGELGNRSEKLIAYFEALPGVSPCPKTTNPSTWMLEIIGAGTDIAQDVAHKPRVDYAQLYLQSALYRENAKRLQNEFAVTSTYDIIRENSDSEKLLSHHTHLQRAYTRSFFGQVYWLIKRGGVQMWRTPEFSLARFAVIVLFSAMFGFIFYQAPLRDVADIQSRVILMFFFTGLVAIYNLYSIVPFAMSRRALFYREQSTGMYSKMAHIVAETLVELPYITVECLLGCSLVYLIVGLNPSIYRFMWMFFITFSHVYVLTMIGLMFSALMPDVLAAQLSGISFVQILQIFSGVLVPGQDLKKPYKPLYWFSIFRYQTEALVTTQFAGDATPICVPFGLIPPENTIAHRLGVCTRDGSTSMKAIVGVQSTVEKFALGEFLTDFEYSRRWFDLIYILSWLLVIRFFLTFIILTFVSHNNR